MFYEYVFQLIRITTSFPRRVSVSNRMINYLAVSDSNEFSFGNDIVKPIMDLFSVFYDCTLLLYYYSLNNRNIVIFH